MTVLTTTVTMNATLWEIVQNVTLTNEEGVVTDVPIISNEVMAHINIYLLCVVCGTIALFGIANNVVNMIVFYRLGINSSMSASLMTLSLTDCFVSGFSLAGTWLTAWDAIYPDTDTNPLAVHFMLGWYRDGLILVSAWVTTFLTMERYVCVVYPFKVKNIFTKSRSFIAMAVIYVVNLGAHLPVFLTQWLEWTTVEKQGANETVFRQLLVVRFSRNRPDILFYIDIVNGAILPIPAQVLVLFCITGMVYGLKVSSRVRTARPASDPEDDKPSNVSNLSDKERKLVKVIIFIAIIFTVCNIPRFLAVYAQRVFPQISFTNSYANLYRLLWTVSTATGTLNSSVNIFVYLTINAKYRKTFRELFTKSK